MLPLLADPQTYRACTWDLLANDEQRAYWLGLFRSHFPRLLAEAQREADDLGHDPAATRRRIEQARASFVAYLDAVTADPSRDGALDILSICLVRERVLRDAGFADPYRLAKAKENEAALPLLPDLLAELDAMPAAEREAAVIEGVFAGNIFDLGAVQTAAMFQNGRVDFHATRDRLKKRPWHVDDFDAWQARLQGRPHEQALLFVDNAGPDVTLGMLPFARFLLQRRTRVILTANTSPSLNDVTHAELTELVRHAAAMDRTLAEALEEGRLRLIASGNGAPLIDLTQLSPELVRAAGQGDVDLVVIEGMGRAIESNFEAKLTCDTLKLAMVKDEGVAEALGGELYDLVLRFDPA